MTHDNYRTLRSKLLEDMGQVDEAMKDLNEAIRSSPDDPQAYLGRAVLQVFQVVAAMPGPAGHVDENPLAAVAEVGQGSPAELRRRDQVATFIVCHS